MMPPPRASALLLLLLPLLSLSLSGISRFASSWSKVCTRVTLGRRPVKKEARDGAQSASAS